MIQFLIGCLILVIVVVIVFAVLGIIARKAEWDADIVKILKLIIGLVALLVFVALLLNLVGVDMGINWGGGGGPRLNH